MDHSPGTSRPSDQTTDPATDLHEQIAQRLAELDVESSTERNVKRIVPWVASVAAHLGMVVLVILIAGTVLLLRPEEEPLEINADFYATTYEPVLRQNLDQSQVNERRVQDRVEVQSFQQTLNDQLIELDVDPLSFVSDASNVSPLADFAPKANEGSVEFVGLSSTNARRIVYVIDASGSMIRSLQIVIRELSRSIEALSQQQNFAIVFFQRNESVVVPPKNRLTPATDEAKIAALEWIDQNVVPSGRSNPVDALRYAFDLAPDVIFLLSENITGSGQFEIDQRELLAILDQLNAVDADGRRGVVVNCIQFLDPDPLDTLRLIARTHGGPNGYKFLDRAELGLSGPR